MAVAAASKPLLPALVPARSMACSMVSVVSTPNTTGMPVSSWACCTPDAQLLELARAGKLHDERVLREQVRRMLQDPKVERFALEFFGQWLGYRDFPAQEA